MAVTKTRTVGYGSRVGNSFRGIWTGIIMFCVGTGLLWWNEGNAVKNAKALEEAQGVAIHVDDVSDVNPSLSGQLIHATAEAKTEEELQDEDFGYTTNAIKLERTVEYYQYVEHESETHEDKLGGKEEITTTYTYKKEWVSSPIDSEEFEDPAYRKKNFVLTAFEEAEPLQAKEVTFGGYKFNETLINEMPGWVDSKITIDDARLKAWDAELIKQYGSEDASPKAVKKAAVVDTLEANTEAAPDSTVTEEIPEDTRYEYVHVAKNMVYFGKNANVPQIGDVRVRFRQVNCGLVSIIAQVNGDTFEEYVAKNKKTIIDIRSGNVSMEKMFQMQEELNTFWLWVLRIIGILVVCGGLRGIFDILSTILKVVPFLSSIMNWGVGLICNVIGVAWSLLVIAIAWLFYRPLIGIAILAIIAAIVGFFVYNGKKKKAAQAEAAPAPAPASEAAPAPAPETEPEQKA